jgi:hypothetical protein
MLGTCIVPLALVNAVQEISKDASSYANNSYAYMEAKKDFIRQVELGAK